MLAYKGDTLGPFHFKKVAQPEIGIALSGGGLRGFAQIGILEELEKAGITVDYIAGSSMGSIVGGLYATGYSPAEIEEFALSTDWANIFRNTPERSTMFIGQKADFNRHLIALRFDGFKPYIPQAISQGQQLFSALHSLIMRANILPVADFDDLRIPLRIIALDKYNGTQKVFEEGNLALTILSSIAAPFLFSEVTIDGRAYVDGGIVNNIPTDVAQSMGSDIIIAVDCTSPLLTAEQMTFPWKQMDHYSTIMQKDRNERSLELADIVIKPDLGSVDGYAINSIREFIELGRAKTRQMMPSILNSLETMNENGKTSARYTAESVIISGNKQIPSAFIRSITDSALNNTTSDKQIEQNLKALHETGYFEDVKAVITRTGDSHNVAYSVVENPAITSIQISGNTVFSSEEIIQLYTIGEHNVFNTNNAVIFINEILNLYNENGYSIAQINGFEIDPISQTLSVFIDEGVIDGIQLIGNDKTQPHIIRREMFQKSGTIFNYFLIEQGIDNIYGTGLFQRVFPTITREKDRLILQINMEEQKSEIVRFGARYDRDQKTKSFIELSDDNFGGLGLKSQLHIRYGPRNQAFQYQFRIDRIFLSYLTMNGDVHHSIHTDFLTDYKRDFIRSGEFKDTRLGWSLSLGRQLGRLGTVSARLNMDDIEIEALPFLSLPGEIRDPFFNTVNEKIHLRTLTFESLIDTRDRFPFPRRGNFHRVYYENASSLLGNEVSYVKFYSSFGYVFTLQKNHTIKSRIVAGFADETLPYSQRFRWGGSDTFFGNRFNTLHGKTILAANLGYRLKVSLQNIFDTYLTVRWDIADLSEKPEKFSFAGFRNAFGTAISFDLPVGPLEIGYGKTLNFGDRIHFSLGHNF